MVEENDDANFDAVTLEKLNSLKQAKEKAVENEDFDTAKHLKEQIDKLKNIGVHLTQLEERKKIAIKNEDYDSAKIIKIEIDNLRSSALGGS